METFLHLIKGSDSLFLEPQEAHGVLVRTRRYNSGWFEELKLGDLERECLEEICSFEEAREVFEHTEMTNEFWKRYSVPDSCKSGPCQNRGTCITDGASYTCLCLPQFRGVDCELGFYCMCVFRTAAGVQQLSPAERRV
uniref:Coagulation factor IXa heavy chain n=1 Tax=Fundulus heteroclitus TaxID=8078 RepID=A0A3Q2R338_FUNHE